MLDGGQLVVVAVSGGPDSIALLRIMETLSESYGLSLIMAHLNHCMRGEESDRDEDFVRKVAETRGINLVCGTVDIPALRSSKGGCMEEIARQERYRFLREVLDRKGADRVALGHHRDDQVETLIMNLLRGSGLLGLKGMSPVREGIFIRPLLTCSKGEILAYLSSEKMEYRLDSTNSQQDVQRNKIRNQLIPHLKTSYNPSLDECISRTADVLRLDEDYLEGHVRTILSQWRIKEIEGEIRINLKDLLTLHEAVQNRILREMTRQLSPEGMGASYKHISSIKNSLFLRRSAGPLYLPYGVKVRREYDTIVLSRALNDKAVVDSDSDIEELRRDRIRENEEPYFLYPVEIPGSTHVDEAGMTVSFKIVDSVYGDLPLKQNGPVVYMDFDAIAPPVVLRSRLPGDRISSLGLGGTKKIKSLLIDEKVPRNRRWRIPLLVDADSVLWIPEMSLSEKVKITKGTRNYLKVEIV